MRQKFFTKTIQSDFIKSLLYNTPLPICNCVTNGDYIVKGHTYAYNRSLIKCTKNGYLKPGLKILQVAPSSSMGLFILGFSTLGFRQPITQVSYGSYIFQGKYYLLGSYDLRYDLEDGDPDYPRFSHYDNYSFGDIVIHSYLNRDYLYTAIEDIQPGWWNEDQWQRIDAPIGPYELILCTDSGNIGDIPSGAAFTVVQEYEPQIYRLVDNDNVSRQYLSGNTFYVIAEGNTISDRTTWEYRLVYNEYPGYLNDEVASYHTLSSYIPEQYYRLYTQRYLSAYDYYDSETHKELSRLLRFYRSAYQLNLLPFYNCWDGSYLDGFIITNEELKESATTSGKLIKVPIQFNKKYTIALDCNSEVKIIPALIKLNDKLTVKLGIGNDIDLCEVVRNKCAGVLRYNQLSFINPITVEIPNKSSDLLSTIEGSVSNSDVTVSQFLQRYENDLYLIIQIPSSNDSSIVVLEGDYTSTKTTNIFNMSYMKCLSFDQFNNYLLSDLSLLMLNDKISYPFADRLVEYLLDNVITNRDEIGDDILRVREKLSGNIIYDGYSVAWDDFLRKTIYDLYMNTPATLKLDISGFVDKDVEEFINKFEGSD